MAAIWTRREVIQTLPALALPARMAWAQEPDWPQWRGPGRNGLSAETGLLKSWPATGPKALWSIAGLGEGFGSMSMQGGQLFVQGVKGGQSTLFCLDRARGTTQWTAAISPSLSQNRGSGPRGTPTIDGDRVYVLTESGELACVNREKGALLWRLNILREFGGRNPNWHVSESPLIDGTRLIVTPGGRGAGVVALDKTTGKTVWTSKELNDPAAYSSCVVADIGGVRTIMTITAEAGVGVRANDGKLLWRYQQVANGVANVTTPVFHDNKVFYTSAYDTGCALLGLRPQAGEVKANEIYFNRDMMNHHGGVVLVNGYLYGFSNAILTCMEFATGRVAWRNRSVGKGCLTYADGHLYLLGETNVAGLAVASHEGYVERGRFSIPDHGLPSWAHPVVCGGKLYIRNQGTLTCYNVKA